MSHKRTVGGVTPLPDGRFWARLTVSGKRESLGIYPTREEAEGVLRATALANAGPARLLDPAHTFARYGAKVLDLREMSGYRASAKDRYNWTAHLVKGALADRPIKEISTLEIGRFVKTLSKKNRKQGDRPLDRATVQKCLTLVSGIFAQAIEDELRPDNPAFGVKVKRSKRAEEIDPDLDPKWDYLRPDEQHTLATCERVPLWGRLLLRVAWGTGLRQGEMWNLELRDVRASEDERHPEIFVRYGSRGKSPKNGKTRTIALFGDALVAMRAWLALLPSYAIDADGKHTNPHRLVFPTQTGCRRQPKAPCRQERVPVAEAGPGVRKTRVLYMLPEWLAIAGVARSLRWHDLRHTCASSLVSGFWGPKWSLDEVRDHMGHSSVKVTEIYAHLDRDATRERARLTTGVMSRVSGGGFSGSGTATISSDFNVEPRIGFEPTTAALRKRGDPERYPSIESAFDPTKTALAEAIMRMAADGDGTRLAMVATALASSILDGATATPRTVKTKA